MTRPEDSSCEATGPIRLLSFDLEEYFQVEAAVGAVAPEQWESFAQRLPPVVERILELLEAQGSWATFFVLSWVARKQPAMIRAIARAGHEVASHGTRHAKISRLTPHQFHQDLLDSRRLLEDITGGPVLGYRAPTFSITHRTAWALDSLAEAGFSYDSSVFPIRHDRYGVPDAPRFAHKAIGPGGGCLLEIPPLTMRAMGTNLPVGGGGYFRLLPLTVIRAAINSAARLGRPAMIYLHPWELDPHQPVLAMSPGNRLRHRLGLARTEQKLRKLLEHFKFTDVARRLGEIQAGAVEVFRYGR